MTSPLFPFLLLAGVGFLLSVGAHLFALLGWAIPGGKLVGTLHIGIFVVWFPAVLVMSRTTRHAKQKDIWKVALAGCPIWMRRAVYFVGGYAVLNFILFLLINSGSIMHSKTSSADDLASVPFIRMFSGHWMAFYGAAFSILYSTINAPYLYRERKCPLGHDVSPLESYCPNCGRALSK